MRNGLENVLKDEINLKSLCLEPGIALKEL